MSKQFMISTDDNPFNPFEQFEDWKAYDDQNGHNSLSILARRAHTSPAFSDSENTELVEEAIDAIARIVFSEKDGKLVHYIKIEKDFPDV